MFVCLAVAWQSGDVAKVIFAIIGGVFLLFLLINLAGGPTCSTRIETSIGGEDIYSLSRWWKAKKVLARLLPLIREAQGGGDPTSLATRVGEGQPPSLSFVDMPARKAALTAASETPGRPWMGFALAAFLLGHALACGLLLLFPGLWGFPTGIGLMLVAVIFDVLVLARPVPGCGRGLTGTVLGWFCVYGGLLYVLMIKAVISNASIARAGLSQNEMEIYSAIFRHGAHQDGYTIFLLAFSAAVSGILGFTTLFRILMARRG